MKIENFKELLNQVLNGNEKAFFTKWKPHAIANDFSDTEIEQTINEIDSISIEDGRYSNALNLKGYMLFYGRGLKRDYAEGFKSLQEAVALKNSLAMINLANIIQNGSEISIDPEWIRITKESADADKEVQKYMSSAKIDFEWQPRNEIIFNEDTTRGIELFRSIYTSSDMLIKQWDKVAHRIDQKKQEFEEIVAKSINATTAKLSYWSNYKPDYQKAKGLYEQAIELDSCVAINNLGCLYQNNFYQDDRACELYQQAAERGNGHAASNLGSMYEAKQTLKAINEFHRAYKLGELKNSINGLERIYNKTSPKSPENQSAQLKLILIDIDLGNWEKAGNSLSQFSYRCNKEVYEEAHRELDRGAKSISEFLLKYDQSKDTQLLDKLRARLGYKKESKVTSIPDNLGTLPTLFNRNANIIKQTVPSKIENLDYTVTPNSILNGL